MGSFSSLNLRKISDCRSFSDLKTLTGCQSFSHRLTLALIIPQFSKTSETWISNFDKQPDGIPCGFNFLKTKPQIAKRSSFLYSIPWVRLRRSKSHLRNEKKPLHADVLIGLSRVPPHERLLNGAITSVCWRLANHSFSSNFWKAGLRPHVHFNTRSLCQVAEILVKFVTCSCTYESH